MYLGRFRTVCVYDYDIAKEMFAKEEASGRPDIFVFKARMLDKQLGRLNYFNNANTYYEVYIFEVICNSSNFHLLSNRYYFQ